MSSLSQDLDRLGRLAGELIALIDGLDERGVGFRALNSPMDTTTPAGRAFLQIQAAFAEMERNVIRQRVREGLKAARARGREGWAAACHDAGEAPLRPEPDGRPDALHSGDLSGAGRNFPPARCTTTFTPTARSRIQAANSSRSDRERSCYMCCRGSSTRYMLEETEHLIASWILGDGGERIAASSGTLDRGLQNVFQRIVLPNLFHDRGFTSPMVRYLKKAHQLAGPRHFQYVGPRRVKANPGPRPDASNSIRRGGHGQAEAVACWCRYQRERDERSCADSSAKSNKNNAVSR